MAILTDKELVLFRNAAEKKSLEMDVPIRWVKLCLRDVAQAMEDVLDAPAFKTAISNAIDGAATPYSVTFTNAEKQWLFAFVMGLAYDRDK